MAYMTLAAAAKTIRIDGYNLSAMTLWRWCVRGCGGTRLRHARIGKRYLIEPGAIDEFLSALTANSTTPFVPDETPSPVKYRGRSNNSNEDRVNKTQQRLAERGL